MSTRLTDALSGFIVLITTAAAGHDLESEIKSQAADLKTLVDAEAADIANVRDALQQALGDEHDIDATNSQNLMTLISNMGDRVSTIEIVINGAPADGDTPAVPSLADRLAALEERPTSLSDEDLKLAIAEAVASFMAEAPAPAASVSTDDFAALKLQVEGLQEDLDGVSGSLEQATAALKAAGGAAPASGASQVVDPSSAGQVKPSQITADSSAGDVTQAATAASAQAKAAQQVAEDAAGRAANAQASASQAAADIKTASTNLDGANAGLVDAKASGDTVDIQTATRSQLDAQGAVTAASESFDKAAELHEIATNEATDAANKAADAAKGATSLEDHPALEGSDDHANIVLDHSDQASVAADAAQTAVDSIPALPDKPAIGDEDLENPALEPTAVLSTDPAHAATDAAPVIITQADDGTVLITPVVGGTVTTVTVDDGAPTAPGATLGTTVEAPDGTPGPADPAHVESDAVTDVSAPPADADGQGGQE